MLSFQQLRPNLMKKATRILLLLNLFLLQSYLIRFKIFAYPSNLQEVLIALNFLTLIAHQTPKQIFKTIKKAWVLKGIVALSLIFAITTYQFSTNINQLDLIRNLKFVFFGALLFLIFINTLNKTEEQEKGIEIAGYGALVFGLFSLIYNIAGYNLTHDLRLNGPLDSAVYLAFYLAPFTIFFGHKLCTKKMNKGSLATFTILAFLLIATKSMGAILAVFICLLTSLYFNKTSSKLKKNIYLKSVVAIAGIVLIGLIIQSKILPTIQTEYSSLDERGQIWITTTQLMKDPTNILFGLGFGQFQEAYSTSATEILGQSPLDANNQHPHNIFLLFFTQYGIIGLIFILTIFCKLINRSRKSINAASLILFYFFIHGIIDSPYFKKRDDLSLHPLCRTQSQLLQTGD